MNFEKITLFTNNIELDSILFEEVLGLEKSEINKSYNKFIINDIIFSINNRQKGLETNYFFEFQFDKKDYDGISEKLNKLTLKIDIRLKDILIFSINNFIFSLNFVDLQNDMEQNFKLNEISFVSSFDRNQLNEYKNYVNIISSDNDKNTLKSNNLVINIVDKVENISIYSIIQKEISSDLEISINTPISIITNQQSAESELDEQYYNTKLNLIFSGKALVITQL